MSSPGRINRTAAENLIARFIPMFAEFEKRGVDYCLVGGLAVVAHCLANDIDSFRATEDADAMVPQDYSNGDFARDYLRVYATDPKTSEAVYKAVFGDDGFKQLSESENAFVNASFIGADADLDGIDTPNFDICRILNGRSLTTIDRERINLLGHEIWVATADELLGMKLDTISLYGADFQSSPRPHDFIDVGTLDKLSDDGAPKRAKALVSVCLPGFRRYWGESDDAR